MAAKKLLLWGETQVGKTTLLASGLLSRTDELPGVDWEASIESVEGVLRERWLRLCKNMPILGTAWREDVQLTFKNGEQLVVSDVQGGMTGETHQPDVQKLLKEADGILVVMEWQPQNLASQMNAVEVATGLFANRVLGLAFTKCERAFSAGDPCWSNSSEDWWRKKHEYERYDHILSRFGSAVWPTSAFGYDDDHRPACVLGEFGQVLPYQVEPRNVRLPFELFFRELGLC